MHHGKILTRSSWKVLECSPAEDLVWERLAEAALQLAAAATPTVTAGAE